MAVALAEEKKAAGSDLAVAEGNYYGGLGYGGGYGGYGGYGGGYGGYGGTFGNFGKFLRILVLGNAEFLKLIN